MNALADPIICGQFNSRARDAQAEAPKLADICDYLAAFFHGFSVKQWSHPFQFVP